VRVRGVVVDDAVLDEVLEDDAEDGRVRGHRAVRWNVHVDGRVGIAGGEVVADVVEDVASADGLVGGDRPGHRGFDVASAFAERGEFARLVGGGLQEPRDV